MNLDVLLNNSPRPRTDGEREAAELRGRDLTQRLAVAAHVNVLLSGKS